MERSSSQRNFAYKYRAGRDIDEDESSLDFIRRLDRRLSTSSESLSDDVFTGNAPTDGELLQCCELMEASPAIRVRDEQRESCDSPYTCMFGESCKKPNCTNRLIRSLPASFFHPFECGCDKCNGPQRERQLAPSSTEGGGSRESPR